MSLWDWLATPTGQGVAHAVEIVLIALGAVLSAWAGAIARHNRELLNGHLRQHMIERYARPKDTDS